MSRSYHYYAQVEQLWRIDMPFAPLRQDLERKIYEDPSQQSKLIRKMSGVPIVELLSYWCLGDGQRWGC
jgi:hypothetical protein